MLIAVDIGNTSTKFGIYDGEELLSHFSIPTVRIADRETLREIGAKLEYPIVRAIVCSVVPDAAETLTAFLKTNQIDTVTASNDLDFGLSINYEPLSAIGTDRLVNALGAAEKYGVPAVVCSFGTATTIDAIDRSHVFLGGLIAPGLKTAAAALRLNTSQLPEVTIERPEELIGTSTASAILSGIVFGHIAMVEGLIERLKTVLGDDTTVIATGGFASLIGQMSKTIDAVERDLSLDGLRILSGRIAK